MPSSKGTSDGLEMAISGNLHDKIKDETGIDLGGITETQGIVNIVDMKEKIQNRIKILEIRKNKIRALYRQINKNLITLKNTEKSLEKYNRNLKIQEFSRIKENLSHDVSQLGLASGHQKKKEKSMNEVFG